MSAVLDLVPVYDLEEESTYEGRQYVTPNGDVYPSVTTILSKQPKPELDEWKERIGEREAKRIVRQATVAGSALHDGCEKYLLGQDMPAMRQGVKMLFRTMQPALNRISVVYGLELPLWSDFLKVAGRTDCVGDYEGIRSIIDFKNSKKHKQADWIEGYFLQTTIYAMMYMSVYGIPVKQVVILVACWDGTLQVFKEPVKKRLQAVKQLMIDYNELW